jgi:hypothetical protein
MVAFFRWRLTLQPGAGDVSQNGNFLPISASATSRSGGSANLARLSGVVRRTPRTVISGQLKRNRGTLSVPPVMLHSHGISNRPWSSELDPERLHASKMELRQTIVEETEATE